MAFATNKQLTDGENTANYLFTAREGLEKISDTNRK